MDFRQSACDEVGSLVQRKKILAVDDEPDVLEIIEEILSECDCRTVTTFEEAERLLRTDHYDMVILDIMGVHGLDLLDTAVECGSPAVMLTAHAFDPGTILQSMLLGAVSFFPKEDIENLDWLLPELFDLMEKGESTWPHAMKRLAPLLDARFTPKWRDAFREMGEFEL
ncbi:MAG: response regulator [Pseudomonadota bacterium]